MRTSASPNKVKGRASARALVVVLAIAAAGLAVLSSGASAASKATAVHSQSYTDPAGDAYYVDHIATSATADIQTVTVSNDPTGLITFKIGVPGSPSLTPDMEFQLFINSDDNSGTGDAGDEYVIDYWTDHTDPSLPAVVGLYKYIDTTTGYQFVSPVPASLSASYADGVATLTIKASDIGIGKTFSFAVWAASGVYYDASGQSYYDATFTDSAPDSGESSYNVVTTLPLSSARLMSTFSVTEKKTLHDKWTFKPRCAAGACNVKARIVGFGSFKLSRSGRIYKGSVSGRMRCTASRTVRARINFRLKITKAAWVGSVWRATAFTGTMKIRSVPCSGGRARTVAWSLKGKAK